MAESATLDALKSELQSAVPPRQPPRQRRAAAPPVAAAGQPKPGGLLRDLSDLYAAVDWADGVEYEVAFYRLKPPAFKGVPTRGHVATYDEPVYEEDLRERHGGGTYRVVLRGEHPELNIPKFTHGEAVVEIAGPPKVAGVPAPVLEERESRPEPRPEPRQARPYSSLLLQQEPRQEQPSRLDDALRLVREVRQAGRPDHHDDDEDERPSRRREVDDGVSTHALDAVTRLASASAQQQRESFEQMLVMMRANSTAPAGVPPETLQALAVAHNAEIAAMRARFEGELAEERKRADRLIEDERTRARSDIDAVHRSAEANERFLKQQYDFVIESLKTSHSLQLDAVRAQKGVEPDVFEQVAKVGRLKEAFEGLTGQQQRFAMAKLTKGTAAVDDEDDDDEDDDDDLERLEKAPKAPKGWFDRVFALMHSPVGKTIAQTVLSQGLAPPQQQQQQQQYPVMPQQKFVAPVPRYVPPPPPMPVVQAQAQDQAHPRSALDELEAAMQADQPEPAPGPQPPSQEEQVRMLAEGLVRAYQTDAPKAEVASELMTIIPPNELQLLLSVDVDTIVSSLIANVPEAAPLADDGGKAYMQGLLDELRPRLLP